MTFPDVARDDESAPFFEGAARGELMVKRCDACGHHVRPVALVCTACRSDALEWAPAAGTGTVVSWAVVHGRDGHTVGAVVELDEGPWFDARLVDADPEALEVGTPVEARFVQAGDEWVPVFAPVARA
jgi:uncharacterized protein